jgi:DNA-binding response OmpR family regulator
MSKSVILVVDDESLNIQLISDILNEQYEIKIAFDGKQALNVLEKFHIDLVLLDISMPNMSGYEVASYIKCNEKLKNIPFIFLTAKQDQSSIIKGFEVGAIDYISKPFNKEELFARVSNHLKTYLLQKELNQKIKELKDAQEFALKQQELILNQSKMIALSEMIENISHQWRQPLSVISTAATGMQIKNEHSILDSQTIEQKCKIIDKTSQYLSSTLDQFKKTIPITDNSRSFNLRNDTDIFLKLIDSSIEKYNIQVILELYENSKIKGYPNELMQCFISIFNNSKDALVRNNIENKLIFINSNHSSTHIIIEFLDNAGGIDESIIDRVFEPYFTTKHQSKGVGLGLYTAFLIITKSLKGTISIKNKSFSFDKNEYIGASVELVLPIVVYKEE